MLRKYTEIVIKKFRRASELRSRFGNAALIKWMVSLIGEKLFHLEVTHVVWLEADNFNLPGEPDSKFTFRFLSLEEIAEFSADPENNIKEAFIERAVLGNDLCFAVLSEGWIASYGWYALKSTAPEINYGVALAYPDHVACMYEGFTHPDFRGMRLHGFGMALALKALEERGITALVSTINWCNWQSLRSCWRLGYDDLGCFKTFGFYAGQFKFYPGAAKKLGVKFDEKNDMHISYTPPENNVKEIKEKMLASK
jgi:hypothetical protein